MPKSNIKLLRYCVLLVFSTAIVFSASSVSDHSEIIDWMGNRGIEETTSPQKYGTVPIAPAYREREKEAAVALFTTIIQGADEAVGCSSNGFTVARFNLCGDSDDRTITLSGGPYASVQWQLLNSSCSFDVNEDCPNTTVSCYSTVGNSSSFTLDASTIPASSGAEYRVVADGQQYFFKVKKSTISQTYVKRDYICGVDGRIQITNLSSAYEFSVDSGFGFGPWQTSPIFNGLPPGTYVVRARLQNTPNTCEYPYEPIVIEQLDMGIDVTYVDAQCFGDTGSITVAVNDVPGPYKYTLLDEVGLPIEFTTFISANPYTFNAVGFGTYNVQVETQQCSGDIANGIFPPRQNVDVNGNAIVIGDGIVPLSASTEVNESLSTEPSCGSPTVDVLVRTSGGTAPYTFTVSDGGVSPGAYSSDILYSVNTAGTYDFLITDANGCSITASANVEELRPPVVTVSGIDGTCTNGGARLDINVVDAFGYNLSFRADPSGTWSTDPLLSVPAGTYNSIQVRYEQSGFSCFITLPDSVTVTESGAINGADPTVADVSCDGTGGTNAGSIAFPGTYSGAGGGPYEFSINGVDFFSLQVFNNLSPGTYTPAVRNSGGCRRDFTPVTIADVTPPTNLGFAQDNTNCALNTSDVTLTPTAAFPIATYEIISPISTNNAGNPTFTGLTNNTNYTFRITDTNGCTYEEGFTPTAISSIRARVKAGGDLNVCTGASDGNGTFIIDGFVNAYTYSINGGAESSVRSTTEVNIGGLGAGNHTITVTDADTGCQDTATLTVREPTTPIDLIANVTPMSCNNNNIGRVRANTAGGFGTYSYVLQWPSPSGLTIGPTSGFIFGNLTAEGTYTLTATDAEGCSTSTTFTLSAIDPPTISLGTVDYCFSPTNDASIEVSSTAGTAPLGSHQYRINGGPLQSGTAFNGLVPGTYTVEVVDGNNCSDALQVIIPPQVQIDLDLLTEIPCGGNGEMRVTVNGGDISTLSSTLYTMYLDGSPVAGHNGVPLTSNPFNYTVPLGNHGDYTVTLTDANGCTNTSPALTFSPPVSISATTNTVGPSCGDASSGYVEIIPDVSMGLPPFEVAFAPGGSGLVDDPFTPHLTYGYGTQTLFSGLPAGTYEYIVKDARNCTTGVQTVVVSPDATNPPNATIVAEDATCGTGALSGGVTITGITDGVGDFTILIEDNFGNEFLRRENVTLADLPLTITDPSLVEGNYTVVTLDSRGCLDQDALIIDSINDLDIVPDLSTPITCDRGNLSQCIDIVNGTGPFEVRLVTDPPSAYVAPNSGARRHCFADLVPGASYVVEVLDTATGCTTEETLDIPNGGSPINVALTMDNASCNAANVTLEYTISGAAGPFDIVITNLDTGAEITNTTTAALNASFLVPQGLYGISVIDNGTDCTGGATVEATLDMPRVDVVENQNANCNELGQLTVRGSGGTPFPPSGAGSLPDGSPYEYAFVDAGVAPTGGDYGTETTVFLTGSLAPGTAYDIWVRDSRGCEFMTSATIVQLDPDLPDPIVSVNNQCDVTAPVGGFQIDLEMPASVVNPTFTLDGQTQTPAYNMATPTVANFTVPSIGVYNVHVIDANGCEVTTTAEVYQLLSASGGFSTDPTCGATDGVITITANGGSGDFSYRLTGTDLNSNAIDITDPNADGIFENIASGTYQVEVTDNLVTDGTNNCMAVVTPIVAQAPVQPTFASTGEINVSCNGASDGSINAVLSAGTDSDGIDEFRLYAATLPLSGSEVPVATNGSGSFTGLGPGTFVVQVMTNRGCSEEEQITLTEPPVFSITANDITLICENGSNRFSTGTVSATVTGVGNGGPYSYRIDPSASYQSSADFDIVDTGSDQTITIYALDSNGCEDSVTITAFTPTNVQSTISTLNNLTCANPERVEISVTGTSQFTVVTTAPSGNTVPDVSVTGGGNAVVSLPVAGDYLFEIQDDSANGCNYLLPRYTVSEPISPTATIAEANPVSCFGSADGALFIELADYNGSYDYEAFLLDVSGNRVLPAQATGTFDTANFPDVNGDAARITGLVGGTYEVEISTTGYTDPQCPAISNVATVRNPNGPLVPTAMEIGNVSCNDDSGVIVANLNGGWDYAPYEYRLVYDSDGNGSFETEVYPWDISDRFENLASGDYRVEYRDVEGCTVTYALTLDAITPVMAGIREPQELICPDGNDAVLEAFDPTTGDALTATAGATGGVAGAGYLYQLIYLASNDVTDEVSRSGLQSSPTFSGASGGFISEGWYAIEISSSFGCSGVTLPYYVDPPPPVIPDLVQVRAPGCGGLGQMRLQIENPEVGFEYEYRLASSAGGGMADPFIRMEDAAGSPTTEVLIEGMQGFYQYEVRKINGANACGTINSNGLTLVDAQNIDLVVNQPDDISCANEIDGRIESFSSGGIGANVYTIYRGDPVDAFAPDASATIVDSNSFGTFEGLAEGTDYYIAVTSGLTCQAIQGPYEVVRPEPILFQTSSTPVSCSGEGDGSITIEVDNGGGGLIQFAISPNFNEFFNDPNNPGTYTFENLTGAVDGQDYTLLIQDSEGCSQTVLVEVFEPSPIAITASTTPEICLGFNEATAQLSISGGTPFVDAMGVPYYEVAMNSSNEDAYERNDSLFFENLVGGEDYVFFVRDANGCRQNIIVPIEIGVDINSQAIVDYGCDGIFPNSTVRIEPTGSASLSDVLFSLDVDDITVATEQRQWGDLPAGDHTVYLYHANGCTTFVDFTIAQYDPLSLVASKTAADEVTALVTGGFGDYEFFFQGQSQGSNNIFNIVFDATVTVRVVDARGCSAEAVFPFEFEGLPRLPDFFTPNGDGLNDEWFIENSELFPNLDVIIYDRYGRVVAQLDSVSGWNGDYEGNPLPTGDYWYVVNANDSDKQQFVGHFTLYR